MKQYTLLAFILFANVCQAQSGIRTDTTNYLSLVKKRKNLPKLDTVKVVLLVSDTVHKYYEYIDGNTNRLVKEDLGNGEIGKVYWRNGYSVRRRYNSNEANGGSWYCYDCEDYMIHSYYLDSEKKVLSPTIIVWQSVERK